ncbi:uncharacterized protein LOC129764548 [Toxorhynchites rutilus septentrionalis]|uniref:uncharacterized protein LOC129764548 n=1 Tax=Toxorhynchites rutilus septentrionalis TaxID=329112 RepID=UPI0024790BCA|nr:uncharacterized protein LOC129764548 [Toxorhynchites rutilus septentrionalis]XP_055619720.1 uncharacterized protein LOC129764548 [Toxorhynchites rutilus septentrionalis]XP_055619721.1 uncharacterized protein LOC129764548 [Toxorhynchites rutilus septentrionalis]XP_055619722.1 uncharacterized protein LOC129764548 [Toxorhynchites rutilus septentrionalis]XP_055619723.1 uncharacterized protein LOC129764548 [Toxorhynchites rutilus septentrionalis]XP_055619725.1 uncharacterized protein LOC12976454
MNSRRNDSVRLLCRVGLILLLTEVTQCLRITELDVPQAYVLQQGEDPPEDLVLDCEYDLEEDKAKGFVLKWKHNDLQIYQWIPSKKPVAFTSFKGHVDLDYSVSDDRYQKYRALKLINPMANFTGNYSCSVQTYDENETKTGHLQIIVPEADFNLTYHRESNGSTVVTCEVSDIFPKPQLSLFIDETQTNEVILSEKQNPGTFDVVLQHVLSDDSKDASIHCQLSIPGTNYTKKREKMYHGAAFRASISILQALFYALTAAVLSNTIGY